MPDRRHDVVLYGATGFVGRLIAAHLLERAPARLRVALAGRSLERLTAVRADLGSGAADWPLIVADSSDAQALAELAASTQVLATTVGPYLRFGPAVVRSCADAGTDYLDLTGETLFVRDCIDDLDATARRTGARLVNSCGFDSVPSDLGVLMLAERARADGTGELTETTLVVTSLRGGISGGTVDSLRAQTEIVGANRDRRRIVADPYGLSPDRSADPDGRDERDDYGVHHDEELGWTGPFVMASYNTRIVRRSNALLDYAYGRGLRYREVMGYGPRPTGALRAGAVTAGLGLFAFGMTKAPTRRLLDRILPAPGEGPSEKTRRNGRFTVKIHTTTTSGARYVATVSAQGDPGYGATAVMFGEAALALALDRDDLPLRAGVLTPASGIGAPLVDRLRAAGFTLAVRRVA